MKDLEYYLQLRYAVRLCPLEDEEGGGWLAEVPLLPGCMADGEIPEDAVANLEDAKRAWIKTALELGLATAHINLT
ncbi:type II toxin-antitoxin system HicB family antitoxin [Kyrpidia tusciae]|uniref:HicB-like antitoxin of toxin-antitoxin system domain-containing protein n=1 Tax=Kyrpidia tusciae (strain DSM 2912 / NBRC 15312 / T2) TaxID=562970 RepID=D5WVQ0_KYRT2|nr:type II toxin-antitoxin system HicB family antitoxin [Kyrpidia tusciae]ADG07593.1 protein of unknown function UPF0150 [Kyrpidia tusciae DSM 2912]